MAFLQTLVLLQHLHEFWKVPDVEGFVLCVCIHFNSNILPPSYKKNIKFCFSSVLKSKPHKNKLEGSCKFRATFQHYSVNNVHNSVIICCHIIVTSQQYENQNVWTLGHQMKEKFSCDSKDRQMMFYSVILTSAEINTVPVIWPAESSETLVVNGMNDLILAEEKTLNLHESARSTSTGTNRETLKVWYFYFDFIFIVNGQVLNQRCPLMFNNVNSINEEMTVLINVSPDYFLSGSILPEGRQRAWSAQPHDRVEYSCQSVLFLLF